MALVREGTQSKGRPVGGLLRVVLIIRLLAEEGDESVGNAASYPRW